VPGRKQNSWRPAQFVGAECGEVLLDRRSTFRGPQIAARGVAPIPHDRQNVATLIENRAQRGEALVAHQHEEMLLAEVSRVAGSKAEGPFSMA